MKKLLAFITISFSIFINSEIDLIGRDGFRNDYYFDCTIQNDMGRPCGMTFDQYIEKLYELEPLSKATSRREKNAFRFKFYKLHSYSSRDPKLSDDEFLYGPAVTTLNAMLLLDRSLNSFGRSQFTGLANHTKRSWDKNNRFQAINLRNALDSDSKITNSSFATILNYAIPAAQYLTNAESYDIGFEGEVEVFSDEYNERIKKIIEYIDQETAGMLSILSEIGEFQDIANDVYKEKLNVGKPSMKDYYEFLCTNVFNDAANSLKEVISVMYLKNFDACNKNDRYALSTGIYNIDSKILQNYDPDFYFNIYYQEYFFPTYHKLDDSEELFLSIGPEILFNAKYGISSRLNLVKEINNARLELKNSFYEGINSMEDIKEETQALIESSSDLLALQKLIIPTNTKEEQIYKAFENYIETDEFQQYLKDAEMEDKFSEISKNPVAENLINLKTASEVVKACYESRVGYALVYFNQNEYSKLKSKFNKKFKDTSSKLSPEIKKEIDIYGFDNFIDWGVKLSLDFYGNLDLLADWTQDNADSCRNFQRQLQ